MSGSWKSYVGKDNMLLSGEKNPSFGVRSVMFKTAQIHGKKYVVLKHVYYWLLVKG